MHSIRTGILLATVLSGIATSEDVRTRLKAFEVVAFEPESGYERWQYEKMAQLLEGLSRDRTTLGALLDHSGSKAEGARRRIAGLFDAARKTVADSRPTAANRPLSWARILRPARRTVAPLG